MKHKRSKGRGRRRTGLTLMAVIVLSVCAIVSIKRQELNSVSAETESKVRELQENIKDAKEESKDIEEKKSFVHSLEYIEEMAREKLGLVYKDEIIFKSEK